MRVNVLVYKRNYMFIRNVFFVVSIWIVSAQSMAGVFVQGGVHFGGDTLATVSFFGSDDQSIEAGGLISASLGYELDISDTFLIKASLGTKFDNVPASNIDVDFTRTTMNGMVFLKGDEFHFGVGVTQHTDIELSIGGFAGSGTADFEDATGMVMQLDYLLNERGYLSLKLTSIDYQHPNSSIEFDASSIGIILGYRFGK